MSYLGLVPSEDTSGETRRQGAITKTGSQHARRLLVEAAWHSVKRPASGPRYSAAKRPNPPR
jgi:transposase